MATAPKIDWNAVIADPRFQALHRKKQGFLAGLMIFSVVFYFMLPIGAAYFQDLFRIKVWGVGQRRAAVRAHPVRGGLAGRVLLLAACGFRIRPPGARDRRGLRDEGKGLSHEHPESQVDRVGGGGRGGAGLRPGPCAGCRCAGVPLAHVRGVRGDHRRHDVRDVPRREAREVGLRLLHRRRRRHGHAERLGDRGRLPVGGIVPRHRGTDLAVRLRRVHVLGRLARRLHHGAAADRRALPQHRPLHALRHPRLPQQPEGDAHRRGDLGDHGLDVLPDRADGRRRRAGEDADRHRLRVLGDRGRRADARLRAVRRHGRHHLGADHQGDPAGDRVADPGDAGLDALRVLAAGLPRRRRRATRRCRPGSRRCSATRRRTCRRPSWASASSSRGSTSRTRSTRSRSAWRSCSAPPACRTS